RVAIAAGHEAVAHLEPPDAAGNADVDEMDAARRSLGMPALRVVEVGVAAVDDRVSGRGEGKQLLECRLGDLAGRHHHPERPAGPSIQNARGASSCSRSSESVDAVDATFGSYVITWWPPCSSRLVMLAPIRPSPIMPSCIRSDSPCGRVPRGGRARSATRSRPR